MSDNTVNIRRKMTSAKDLQSVVRTMKNLAASNISQYEKATASLSDYYHTVELGLSVCLKQSAHSPLIDDLNYRDGKGTLDVIVFGSDQGLVGQFNDVVSDYAIEELKKYHGKTRVWAVGERVYLRLQESGLTMMGLFAVPNSVQSVAPLIGQILVESEKHRHTVGFHKLYLFYNHQAVGIIYEPTCVKVLPLDEAWRRRLVQMPWPEKYLPQVVGDNMNCLKALISEYLFASIYKACTESLASENTSRLMSMQRADKNIEGLLVTLNSSYNRMRQTTIDEELFDVISGFEALTSRES